MDKMSIKQAVGYVTFGETPQTSARRSGMVYLFPSTGPVSTGLRYNNFKKMDGYKSTSISLKASSYE